MTFIVEDQPVHAHRAILSNRCDHFLAMFRSGMIESTEREIRLPNMSHAAFVLVMEYIYTDSVKIDAQHAVEVYVAADLYQLDRLKEMCSVVVKRSLNCENAPLLLQEANNAHCFALKKKCMEYIIANFDIVSKSEGIKEVSHALLLEVLAMRP